MELAYWTWSVPDRRRGSIGKPVGPLSGGEGEAARSLKATSLRLRCPEKPRCERHGRPYRKPTLVGGGKRPKVIERTLVKELGKLTP